MREHFYKGLEMSQNVIIQEKDNAVVIQFTGIDLTQATDLVVRLGNEGGGYTDVSLANDPDNVVIEDSTTLKVYAGDLFLSASEFNIEVTYFDADSTYGTLIAGKEIGNLPRVEVSGYSNIITYESLPEFANSFVDYYEFIDYCYKRRLPVPSTTSQGQQCLLDAMDYLLTFESNMQGYRSEKGQNLMWPRRGVCLYGYQFPDDEIPDSIKKAQMEAAAYAVNNELMVNEVLSNVKKEKIDVLETEYFEAGVRTKVNLPRVLAHLGPLMLDNNVLVRS